MLHSDLPVQFPHCGEEAAVSVSCLDIHYYVKSNTKTKMAMMDQKNEMEPLVLETVVTDFRNTSNMANGSDRSQHMH